MIQSLRAFRRAESKSNGKRRGENNNNENDNDNDNDNNNNENDNDNNDNNNNHFSQGPLRSLPTRGSTRRGLLPPPCGGSLPSKELPVLPIPSSPAQWREETTHTWSSDDRCHHEGGAGFRIEIYEEMAARPPEPPRARFLKDFY